jgi:MYXO-CTERM domain-containing protein
VQAGVNGDSVSWNLVSTAQGMNLTSGLAVGSYTIEFQNTYTFTRFAGFTGSLQSASTEVSMATFSVVPAPGAAVLLGLAGLAASRRRS